MVASRAGTPAPDVHFAGPITARCDLFLHATMLRIAVYSQWQSNSIKPTASEVAPR